MPECLKTLVVEDKILDQNRILRCLQKLQRETEILCASSVAQALDLLHENTFDLAIIDIELGDDPQDRCGIHLLAEIDEKHPQTRAIISTIWDNKYNNALCMQHGARAIVPKVSLEELLQEAVEGTMQSTSMQPNYGQIGDSLARHIEGLPHEAQIDAIVELLHKLNISTRQLKDKGRDRRFKLTVEALDEASAAKFRRIIADFTSACYWVNRNLDPSIKSVAKADRLFSALAIQEYEGKISSTQARLAIVIVMEARRNIKTGIDKLQFENKAVYPSRLMTILVQERRVNLKTEAKSYGRTELTISPDTDPVRLSLFEEPTRGELTYIEDLRFELTLIRKIG